MRGGSWNNNPRNLRCANRNRNTPDNRNNNIGFRVVFSAPSTLQQPEPVKVISPGAPRRVQTCSGDGGDSIRISAEAKGLVALRERSFARLCRNVLTTSRRTTTGINIRRNWGRGNS